MSEKAKILETGKVKIQEKAPQIDLASIFKKLGINSSDSKNQ